MRSCLRLGKPRVKLEVAGTRSGRVADGLEAQHPFLPRTSKVIAADFVTMDTGTGAVHIAPGHGEDDYIAGVENGLPILSPVDDYGKFTEEVGVPEWVGKYVFDANADVIAHPARKRRAAGRAGLSALVSVLLALEDADHLPRGGAVLHQASTPSAPTRSRRSTT